MDRRNITGGNHSGNIEVKIKMKLNKTHKKLVILGAGESGVGTALLGKSKGYEVFVSDFGTISEKYKNKLTKAAIDFESEQHTTSKILEADIVVKSPGIPDKVSIVQQLLKAQIPVISEIEFANNYTSATIVGITGSNGKTTTTLLTAHVLSAALPKVQAAGNIGDSFAEDVLKGDTQTYVLELSSFQLDGVFNFNPKIAVITNLSPDHLDRYDYDYKKYIASKFNIVKNQSSEDYFIYDADDSDIIEYLKTTPVKSKCFPFSLTQELKQGTFIKDNQIIMKSNNNIKETLMHTNDLSLQGKHNTKNAMAAATVAKLLGIRKQTIRESLSSFQGVPHRLENVQKVNHVNYINDSKATNVNATYYALEAVKASIVWIVGGVDKGNDYSQLYALVRGKVKAIICLGKDNSKIMEAFENCTEMITETESMEAAVKIAATIAEESDTVLLSPCCASFDLFENYEDRGDQFKKAVRQL